MANGRYFASRYLNVIDLGADRGSLLFNGMNGSLDEVPGELGDILTGNDPERIAGLSPANRDFLAARGHLTPLEPAEELRRFRDFAAALHEARTAQASSRGLLLLLSYRCNLACPYCFQQKSRPARSGATMSVALVDDIFGRRLDSMFPGRPVTELYFYGGEPFLPANGPAIRAALGHAKARGITAKAITNGTRLDRLADIFGPGPGQVSWVQVSLDGAREAHDASRVPASGKPTFDAILANVRLLLGRGTQIAIRLNLDSGTAAGLPALIETLKAEGIAGNPLVNLYAAPVHDNLGALDGDGLLGVNALAEAVSRLGSDLDNAVSIKANALGPVFDAGKGLALHNTCYCMQTAQNTLVVDPFGDLYACFEEAGAPDRRVGRLNGDGVEFFPLHEVYKTRHLANLPKCLECSVALACGGQCGVTALAANGDLFEPVCRDTRQIILQGLRLAHDKRAAAPAPG